MTHHGVVLERLDAALVAVPEIEFEDFGVAHRDAHVGPDLSDDGDDLVEDEARLLEDGRDDDHEQVRAIQEQRRDEDGGDRGLTRLAHRLHEAEGVHVARAPVVAEHDLDGVVLERVHVDGGRARAQEHLTNLHLVAVPAHVLRVDLAKGLADAVHDGVAAVQRSRCVARAPEFFGKWNRG